MREGQRNLVEGRDFRIDHEGRLVFTAAYLLKRGACCGEKCRNCPFGWEFVPRDELIKGEPQPPLDEECREALGRTES